MQMSCPTMVYPTMFSRIIFFLNMRVANSVTLAIIFLHAASIVKWMGYILSVETTEFVNNVKNNTLNSNVSKYQSMLSSPKSKMMFHN